MKGFCPFYGGLCRSDCMLIETDRDPETKEIVTEYCGMALALQTIYDPEE